MAMTDSEKNALKGLNPDGTPMNESQRKANKAKVDAKNAESIKQDKAEHGGRSLTERRTEETLSSPWTTLRRATRPPRTSRPSKRLRVA